MVDGGTTTLQSRITNHPLLIRTAGMRVRGLDKGEARRITLSR